MKTLPHTKKYFLLFLCVLHSTLAFTQNNKIDSLKKELQHAKADTNKVKLLNDLGWELKNSNPDTAILLSNQALQLSQKLNWQKGIARSFNNLGSCYRIKSDYPKALEYYFKALSIWEDIGNKRGLANTLNNIGNIYTDQSDYPKALEYYFKALSIWEDIGDKRGLAGTLNNIGVLYANQSDYPKALEYHFKALKIREAIGDKQGLASSLSNIGNIYAKQSDYPKALEYYFKALSIWEDIGDKQGLASTLNNIGIIYTEQSDYPKALEYYFKALKIREAIGDKQGLASTLANIGSTYTQLNRYTEAEKYLQEALNIDKAIGAKNGEREDEELLTKLYEKTGQYHLALEHYKKAMVLKDSLFSEEKKKEIMRKEMTYQFEKQQAKMQAEHEKKMAVAKEQQRRQKITIYAVSTILLLVILFAVFVVRSLVITKKQKRVIEEQKLLVEQKNKEIEVQKKLVEDKNKDILDSITYAKRIQDAMLPKIEDIQTLFSESFILFKPRDIVSGDFYYFRKVKKGNKELLYIAAADCTGHGVPGAFVSLIGYYQLDDAVEEGLSPSEVLKQLNIRIKQALKQTAEDSHSTRDGMDIALCCIDKERKVVEFAGANRPLWVVHNGSKEIEEIKPTKLAIGGFTGDAEEFEGHRIELNKGGSIYLFSDGYADTVGGEKGKRLGIKKMQEIILSLQDYKMEEQRLKLDEILENWRGKEAFIDDILVMGVRL